ncbi:MAG TPA: DUF4340 domain-containing protein [Bacteroidota bacterium]|jgi:LysM repeat protein|nr:DUF4340 domain-containing protein [Bacteroidota bacterium]
MNRSTWLLIGLLFVVGAIIFILNRSGDEERVTSDKAPEVTISIDSASVVKLEIQHPPRSITLENVGGKWTITSPARYQADPAAVTRLISGFSKFKVGSLVSSNPEKQRLFQVDSSGTQVLVTERSGKSTGLVLGKTGPSFSDVYFRLPASNDVYLGEGIDSWSINKELKEWRDKTILAQPSEAIQDLSFSSGGKQYDFHRDSTTWVSGGKTIETAEINPLLSTLSNLRADDFIDTSVNFSSLPVTIDVHATENVTLNLYPSTPDSSKYIVKSSTGSQLYVISKYTAQQLLKPITQGAPAKTSIAAVPPPTSSEIGEKTPEVKKMPKQVTETETASKRPPDKKATELVESLKKEETTSPPAPTGGKTRTAESTQSPSSTSSRGKASNTTPTSPEDEGELTVYTVKKGDTMQSVAKKYSVTVDQILKWNLLKSIAVKPGQELYIYERK